MKQFHAAVWSLSAVLALSGAALAEEPKSGLIVRPTAVNSADGIEFVFVDEKTGEVKPGEQPARVWIGLACSNVKPEVRAQLALPEGAGVMVDRVEAGSPAEKAGIKPYDVIVAVGDKELKSQTDLSAAIQEAGKSEVALAVIRGGQKQSIAVTPAEMPRFAIVRSIDAGRFFDQQLPQPNANAEAFRFHMVHPGIMIDIGRPLNLPEGMSVTVTKQGKEPATITVQQGDKTWKATEDKIDDLPQESQPWVRRSLGAVVPPRPQADPNVLVPRSRSARIVLSHPPVPAVPGVAPGVKPSVEQRLDETLKQLESLRKAVEDLRKELPKPATP